MQNNKGQQQDANANNISNDESQREPKSVKDLKSMFEQNIRKPTIVNENALRNVQEKEKRGSRLLTNVFEAQI